MKRLYLFLLVCFPDNALAQISTAAHNDYGLANVYFNPAYLYIPDQIKWSANLLSFQFQAFSNTASLSLPRVFSSNDLIRKNILGTAKASSGYAGLDIKGPSFGIRINDKTSIALTTRSRLIVNFRNLNGRLISDIGEVHDEMHTYPYSLVSSNNMLMNIAAFSDVAIALSRILWANNRHQLRGGISFKYINGVAHSSLDVTHLTGVVKLNKDNVSFLSDATGKISAQTAGNLLADFNLNNLIKPRKGSMGADLGLAYDFSNNSDGSTKLSIMLSITDVGKVRYQSDSVFSKSYNVNIPANKGLYFNNNFVNSSFSKTTEVFDKYPEYFRQTSQSKNTYKISLPTTLRLKVNYLLKGGFSAITEVGLNMKEKNQINNIRNFSYVSLTPNLHKNSVTLSLPLSYQKYTGINIGTGFGYKGFYIGSNSLISALVSSRQIDVFMGLILSPAKKTSQNF